MEVECPACIGSGTSGVCAIAQTGLPVDSNTDAPAVGDSATTNNNGNSASNQPQTPEQIVADAT